MLVYIIFKTCLWNIQQHYYYIIIYYLLLYVLIYGGHFRLTYYAISIDMQ